MTFNCPVTKTKPILKRAKYQIATRRMITLYPNDIANYFFPFIFHLNLFSGIDSTAFVFHTCKNTFIVLTTEKAINNILTFKFILVSSATKLPHIYLINDPKIAILIKSFIHRSYKCEGKLLHLYQMIKRPLTRFTTRNIQFLKCASKLSHLTNSQLIPCFRL